VYAEHDGRRVPNDRFGQLGQQRRMLGLVPFDGKLIRRTDDQATLVEGNRLGGLQPSPDRMIRKFAMRLVKDALPCVFCGQLHRDSKTVGD
jgi:hypothetical protein